MNQGRMGEDQAVIAVAAADALTIHSEQFPLRAITIPDVDASRHKL